MSVPLVDDATVRSIVEIPSDRSMDPYIQAAHLIIDEQLSATSMSVARLKQIELYLAAHFAVVSEERGGLTYQQMGTSQDRYTQQSWGPGLRQTRFGVQAIEFDTSGTLEAIAAKSENTGKLSAQFRILGTRCGANPFADT